MALPEVLRNRDFDLYWAGVVLSQIGTRGTVVTRAFLGDAVDHVVAVGKHEIRARTNPDISIEPGTQVYLQLDPSKISLVPVN